MKKLFAVPLLLVFCIALLTACENTTYASSSQTHVSETRAAVPVSITLSDFAITSSVTAFKAGIPYHFTVVNTGIFDHELMLMSTTMKTMNMKNMPMSEMDQMSLVSLERMKPGVSRTFDYTFLLSKTGPQPELSCHMAKHYERGMHLDLTVHQ